MSNHTELDRILAGKQAESQAAQQKAAELTTAEKFQTFGQALKFFGSAFSQFQGGPNTDPSVTAHKNAIARATEATADIQDQIKTTKDLTEFFQKNVAPDKQITGLTDLVKATPNMTPDTIAAVRAAGLALRNPREVADAQAGASVLSKLTEIRETITAMQDPAVAKALGLTPAQAKKLSEATRLEGGLAQIAAFANQSEELAGTMLEVTDQELVQLQNNPKVQAQANQIIGAQPVGAFEAGEIKKAQVAATPPPDPKPKAVPKSKLLDERGEVTPVALNRVQQSLGQIIGGKGITFDAQGNVQVLKPETGLKLGRMAGRAAELIKGGKGLQAAVNAAAEAEGFDVSGARAASTEAAAVQVDKDVTEVMAKLDAVPDLTQEQFSLILSTLRKSGREAVADRIEEERGGFFAGGAQRRFRGLTQ